MTNAREQLIAYLATLAALVLIFDSALFAGAIAPGVLGKLEIFGLGTVLGGLIGLLRLPSARNPVGTTESGDVNVTPAAPTPSPEEPA